MSETIVLLIETTEDDEIAEAEVEAEALPEERDTTMSVNEIATVVNVVIAIVAIENADTETTVAIGAKEPTKKLQKKLSLTNMAVIVNVNVNMTIAIEVAVPIVNIQHGKTKSPRRNPRVTLFPPVRSQSENLGAWFSKVDKLPMRKTRME